jgi:aconitate hydratase
VSTKDPAATRDTLAAGGASHTIHRLDRLGIDLDRLPYTVKVLLENVLRNADVSEFVTMDDLEALAGWTPRSGATYEVPYMPARVVLQDFTGVPCVVDLAAMRDAMSAMGGDPTKINPLVPADLVIDHSVQVDAFGHADSFAKNVAREYERNGERYQLLRWAQKAFRNFSAVPPGTGIVHQVNIEYLARVVETRDGMAFPDTLVGTDSHTTMVNGLGVLGFGVGGIEAEAVLLGQPLSQPTPQVVGMKMKGALPSGATATDLVLTVTEILRKQGVVGKFVEFYGAGLSALSLADRATIANMAPEYGATGGMFPIDDETLVYLRMTGRRPEQVALVEAYAKEQGMFRTDATPDPEYDEALELDLGSVVPSLAGPRRPQDRVSLPDVDEGFRENYPEGLVMNGSAHYPSVDVTNEGKTFPLSSGSVTIAAITSCTNTSNPSVLVAAGLLAKKALARGLTTPPWVKTSFAPGSRAVTKYLDNAGLTEHLDSLGFNLVGYGCTTCIGNSGPLDEPISKAIEDNDLVVAAVLSGNRNFEGRVHPHVRAAYLASPPLVVAYALAGRVDGDMVDEPLGTGSDGQPVYLHEIWPSRDEVDEVMKTAIGPNTFAESYAGVFDGDAQWQALPAPEGSTYAWDSNSTYVQLPPFFEGLTVEPKPLTNIEGARVLVKVADSVTTDHISPAGSIAAQSPAGRFLQEHGVEVREFNSYGSRRGNHEVMMRGTFANIRLRNALADGKEGNWTKHLPSGEVISVYDASMRYQADGTPLVVLAGKEYGTGSSRDWAAKGTLLLGVKAVLAESFERIHRGNLVGMGVLPLQYLPGENAESLGLTGTESFSIRGLSGLTPRQQVDLEVTAEDGSSRVVKVLARIDGPTELTNYLNGGILPTVLRRLYKESTAS